MITATRYHDISCGHRVVGHEGKCALLHGHNYRIHFTLKADLDHVGRVVDFGIIKGTICEWLEANWDHRMLLWEHDSIMKSAAAILKTARLDIPSILDSSTVWVPFNPTAENMAVYLATKICPALLPNLTTTSVVVEETRKCSARWDR